MKTDKEIVTTVSIKIILFFSKKSIFSISRSVSSAKNVKTLLLIIRTKQIVIRAHPIKTKLFF